MKRMSKITSLVLVFSLMLSLVACGTKHIPDAETVSMYSEEELRDFANTVDEQTLVKNWGEPLSAGNERLWPVEPDGGTKYMVAYVEDGKVISLTYSKTLFINVVMSQDGITYCTFGWDQYSSAPGNLAFMPTQDIFGNAINCDVGDQIIFETDGMVAESYPAQLSAPYSVRVMGHLTDEEVEAIASGIVLP